MTIEFRPTPPAATTGPGELDADTHGLIVAADGGTTTAAANIGSITLPSGGPWLIFGTHCQVVQATLVAAEYIGGHFRLVATAGDLVPNPAPLKLPVNSFGSALGTALAAGYSPLNIHNITYVAPGKSSLDIVYYKDIACAVAPKVVAGILFGSSVPQTQPIVYCDQVNGTVAVNTDTSVGTITLAEKSVEITGVCGMVVKDGVAVTIEELIGYFTLTSDDIKMTPFEFPLSGASDGGLGTPISNPIAQVPVFIPVRIPITGGARISATVKLTTALTNPANTVVYLTYR